MDMDISMDIHAEICGYGYGYGLEISYPRQPWLFSDIFFVRVFSATDNSVPRVWNTVGTWTKCRTKE